MITCVTKYMGHGLVIILVVPCRVALSRVHVPLVWRIWMAIFVTWSGVGRVVSGCRRELAHISIKDVVVTCVRER